MTTLRRHPKVSEFTKLIKNKFNVNITYSQMKRNSKTNLEWQILPKKRSLKQNIFFNASKWKGRLLMLFDVIQYGYKSTVLMNIDSVCR